MRPGDYLGAGMTDDNINHHRTYQMTCQREITQVTIGPPRPTDPPKLLCSASIDWRDANAAQRRYHEVLVKELAS